MRGLTHHWRLSTVPSRTPDEHAVLLTQLLDLEGLDISTSVSGIAVCSSVPHVTAELRQMASRWFSALPSVVLGPGTKSGMPILYDNPKEVGADRIADAVGAYDLLHWRPLLRGRHGHRHDGGGHQRQEAARYMGGAITPGVGVSLDRPLPVRRRRCAAWSSSSRTQRHQAAPPSSRSRRGRSTASPASSGTLARRFAWRSSVPPPWWPPGGFRSVSIAAVFGHH